MAASGRFHGPATRARATWTLSPGGAYRLNCGSVMLLTDGMIIPIRAWLTGVAAVVLASVETASMLSSAPRGFPYDMCRADCPRGLSSSIVEQNPKGKLACPGEVLD